MIETPRLPYRKPQIIRHQDSVSDQFGRARGRRVMGEIDGHDTGALLEKYGSPLFLFSERDLREKARTMREAFTSRWSRVSPGWSYKTNHLDAICGLFHQEGWGAEVVSSAEYAMARRLGCPGSRIVFNGACKPEGALRLAIEEDALIQIDHADELTLIEKLARSWRAPGGGSARGAKRRVRVGLRVNMHSVSLGANWDRFGFNLESGEAERTAGRVAKSAHLELVGLHCHLGTYILQPEEYRASTRRLCDLALRLESSLQCSIDFINVGGGFPSRNVLYSQYGTPEDSVPPIERYAELICSEMERAFGKRRRTPPTLGLESGRALVDEAGTLLTTIMGVRRAPAGRGRSLVLDAGVNLLYTATWYRHDVVPTRAVEGHLEETTLLGPLCMAIDVLRSGLLLPPLEAGHHLAIFPVGAYNVTQWMQFSQMRPAVLMLCEDGTVEVIRRAETIMDLKDVERLPARFVAEGGTFELPRPAKATRTRAESGRARVTSTGDRG